MAFSTETLTRTPRVAFVSFLLEELAPRPGRIASVVRIAGSCALIVWIAMLYQIPFPGYMAYVVFLCSGAEAASSLLTGLVGALAATLAVAASLLFYALDASEPALRLPLMAVSAFLGIFLMRTTKIGPLAFLASFVLVISQTLIDGIPNLELLTRLVLWLWVVAVLPASLTVLVNLLIGESPARLARRTACGLLDRLAMGLRSGDTSFNHGQAAEAIGLVELRQRANLLDPGLRGLTTIDTQLIETLVELLALHRLLPADTPLAARLHLAEACEQCRAAFEHDDLAALKPQQLPDSALRNLSAETRPVIVAMANNLKRLSEGLPLRRTAAEPPPAPVAKSLFVADAFSNPDHVRFALKTTLAIMVAYLIYNAVDWQGIRTSVVTCFFVALGSLGETMHKLTLRLTGALIGGMIGALCIVYLLPQMEDIGQLCLLIFGVSITCAWVATSSDRLSYAGMQMAFAFFIGVLGVSGDYTPFADFPYASDLTVLRDRVCGILLGNLLMSLVFASIWPVSATGRARVSMAAALRALGQLLADEGQSKAGARLAVIRALAEARRLQAMAAFESGTLSAGASSTGGGGLSISALEHLAGAVFTVVQQETPMPALEKTVRLVDQDLSATLISLADNLSGAETAKTVFDEASKALGFELEELPRQAAGTLRAALEARALLQGKIGNAAAVLA